jgi:two-component system NarL family sensor kinase
MNAKRPPVANDPDPISTSPETMTGEQLSVLFENKEYLAGYLKAKERERIRFSRELHDSIGQLLLALRLDVSKLARTTASGLAEAINDVQCDAHEIEDKVRALAFLHYPAELSRDGLPIALRNYVAGFGKRTGIRASFRVEGECTYLKCEAALALLRVAQEAMTNAFRHGGAKSIKVNLALHDTHVRLKVADDGCGMSLKSALATSGVGLKVMRSRMHVHSGTLSARSRKHGTSIVAVVPRSSTGDPLPGLI